MTTTDRTYHEGETFLLPVTVYRTAAPDRDGEVLVTTDSDKSFYVPASPLLPPDRTFTAPEGFRIIPTEDWTEGRGWWRLAYPTTDHPLTHRPADADRTHIMVRDTPPPPPTERIPWHAAVGRTVPSGETVKMVGQSGKYPHGAISLTDGEAFVPVWYPASDDGTVKVLTTTREVTP